MEFVDGGDLSDLMSRTQKFSISEVINFTRQMVEGVQALHSAGIIHRDLKPENVLLTKNQEIKISDFGIAIIENKQRRTATGGLLGTASYLSPEYLTNNQIDKRADIYAIGIIAYELLLKKHPFEAGSIYETVQNQMAADFSKPKHLRAECPQELEDFIVKALRANPDDRFQDCAEMLRALDAALKSYLGHEKKVASINSETIKLEFEESDNVHAPLTSNSTEKLISNSSFQSKPVVSQSIVKSASVLAPARKPARSSKSLILAIVIALIIMAGLVVMARQKDRPDPPASTANSTNIPKPANGFKLSKYTAKINKKFNSAESDTSMEIEIVAGKIKSLKANISPLNKDSNQPDTKIQSITLQADKFIEEIEGTFTAFANTDVFYTQGTEAKVHKATAKLALLIFKDTGLVTVNYYSPVNLKLDSASKEILFNIKDSAVSFYLNGRQSFNLQ